MKYLEKKLSLAAQVVGRGIYFNLPEVVWPQMVRNFIVEFFMFFRTNLHLYPWVGEIGIDFD